MAKGKCPVEPPRDHPDPTLCDLPHGHDGLHRNAGGDFGKWWEQVPEDDDDYPEVVGAGSSFAVMAGELADAL